MNKTIKFIISFVILVIFFSENRIVSGQNTKVDDYKCTPSSNKALFTVKFFLTMDFLEKERIESGTNGIAINEIQHVDNYDKCIKLDQIVHSNLKLREINEKSEKTRFYYQTNNFYYIFWDYADDKPRMGPKKIFIVVNNQFKIVGEFYI